MLLVLFNVPADPSHPSAVWAEHPAPGSPVYQSYNTHWVSMVVVVVEVVIVVMVVDRGIVHICVHTYSITYIDQLNKMYYNMAVFFDWCKNVYLLT